jgi:hypothetical protein
MMAQVKKAQRRLSQQTEQSEFHVKTKKVLRALLDDSDVQEGDQFSFVSGNDELIIVRKRGTLQMFQVDDDEDTLPAPDAKGIENGVWDIPAPTLEST